MRLLFLMGCTCIHLWLFSCQASFTIRPESLPKKLHSSREIYLTAQDKSFIKLSEIYRSHLATVVIFWQISCPCVKRYQSRIENLYRRYKDQNMAFLYVSSNTFESFDQVQKEYEKRANLLPIFRDDGQLAQAIGVKGTPTAAIIDQDSQIVFLGWPDNERDEHEKGRLPYLENAIVDIINKRPIKTKTSPMFGCPIR
jgi:hypothetical protein